MFRSPWCRSAHDPTGISQAHQWHRVFLGEASEVPLALLWVLKIPPKHLGWKHCSEHCSNTQCSIPQDLWICVWLVPCVPPAAVPACAQVMCSLVSYWDSAGLAPSHLLGLGSQVFLEERDCISLRCQSFREVMLDLISFHFALYAQWITSVQGAQSARSPGQGAILCCHHTLTWLYLISL